MQAGKIAAAREGFQPTPSSRRETHAIADAARTCYISTHSLLAEGDDGKRGGNAKWVWISTHSLLAEGDPA